MTTANPGTTLLPFVRDLLVKYSLTQRLGPIAGPWLHEALGARAGSSPAAVAPEPINDVALDVKAALQIQKADGKPIVGRSTIYRLIDVWPPPASLGGASNVSARWRNRAEFFAWLEEAQRRKRLPQKPAAAPRSGRRRATAQPARQSEDPLEALSREIKGRRGRRGGS